MLFSENINLFNHGSRTEQTDRQDYYGNTALCAIVHRVAKITHWPPTFFICHQTLEQKGFAPFTALFNASTNILFRILECCLLILLKLFVIIGRMATLCWKSLKKVSIFKELESLWKQN